MWKKQFGIRKARGYSDTEGCHVFAVLIETGDCEVRDVRGFWGSQIFTGLSVSSFGPLKRREGGPIADVELVRFFYI